MVCPLFWHHPADCSAGMASSLSRTIASWIRFELQASNRSRNPKAAAICSGALTPTTGECRSRPCQGPQASVLPPHGSGSLGLTRFHQFVAGTKSLFAVQIQKLFHGFLIGLITRLRQMFASLSVALVFLGDVILLLQCLLLPVVRLVPLRGKSSSTSILADFVLHSDFYSPFKRLETALNQLRDKTHPINPSNGGGGSQLERRWCEYRVKAQYKRKRGHYEN